MRRKSPSWEKELDAFFETLLDLIDGIDGEDAQEILDYLDWAQPMLRSVQAPSPFRRALRRFSVVANILVLTLCLVMVIGAAFYSASRGPDGSFFGLRFYHVISESMTPTVQPDGRILKGGFYKGDAIVVKNATPESVKVGDVITFWKDGNRRGKPWTHRVVEIQPYPRGGGFRFVTKGDHNRAEDSPPVDGNDLIGVKLFSIPQLGVVLEFAQKHFILTIVLCLGLALGVFALLFWSTRRRKLVAREAAI